MMHPFMTLEDNTEIVYSEELPDGEIKVYIETPDAKDGFHDMTCYLPSYRTEVHGYTQKEVDRYMDIIRSTARAVRESRVN